MNKVAICIILILCVPALSAAGQETSTNSQASLREVHGQTIISKEQPLADLTFANELQYVGGQRVNLYGNADAEQHLFVKAGDDHIVERFYWVQFEHFLPSNTYSYKYPAEHTTNIGGLEFIYDVKSWADYRTINADDPKSDGAAIARLMQQHGMEFPKRAARVRMFHLPTPDHRTELMIIYGEALPENSAVPVAQNGINLDKESPADAQKFLQAARRDLTIQTH